MPAYRKLMFLCAGLLSLSCPVLAADAYDLEALLRLTREHNRSLVAGRQAVAAVEAGIETASAFPNPELEYTTGSVRARVPGPLEGTARGVWISQRIEYPSQREARIGAARAATDAAGAELQGVQGGVLAEVKRRFYELLRRQAELATAREDQMLMEQIRTRVDLKVGTGEAARYELIKADAEALNAQKAAQSAALRVFQAKAALRQAVGAHLAHDFEVKGQLERPIVVPPLDALRTEVVDRNPELQRLRAMKAQAERQLDYERSQRLPSLTLKGGRDEDPEIRAGKVGVVVSIPIFDRRRGPIDAAAAQLARTRHELEGREFALQQEVEGAYRQYEMAATQVTALETGIVRQAGEALRIAEAAYRYGERGILDYLDAQRVYRSVRNELIAARYDLQVAAIEIERLRALQETQLP